MQFLNMIIINEDTNSIIIIIHELLINISFHK